MLEAHIKLRKCLKRQYNTIITKQFVIKGKVQGVAYRYFAQDSAEKLGIKGWAKNQVDGTVKLLAQAEEGPLSLFEAYLYKGSVHSRVEELEITIIDIAPVFIDFKIVL